MSSRDRRFVSFILTAISKELLAYKILHPTKGTSNITSKQIRLGVSSGALYAVAISIDGRRSLELYRTPTKLCVRSKGSTKGLAIRMPYLRSDK